MLDPTDHPLDLDVLVLPESTLILTAAVIEPLRAANRLLGRRQFRWRIVSLDGKSVNTASGIPIPADDVFRPAQHRVPLVVIASYDWRSKATPTLRARLAQAGRVRSAIIGVEAGTWFLADAGLLDRRKATTHWEDFDEFRREFPDIDLVRDRYVIDGNRITTGGSLPTLDLMLEVIRRRHGYSLAFDVSRLFIYDPAGGENPRYDTPSIGNLRMLEPRVADAVAIMEETIDAPLTLTRIARRVGVSARRLQSLFQSSLGVGPSTHYQALRLNAARRMVIETRLPIADIAAATGFNSAPAFARCYRNRYGEAPRETRRSGAGYRAAAPKSS